ncbi:MAG: hydantoinase B/oxoprolinase family protein [Streptosporangiaceae bacterium]|jgi:N-methylhydantoinase B
MIANTTEALGTQAFETDPVILQIIRSHLITTCEEMGRAMMRTAYSPIFNEGHDLSCALFDSNGEMIAQGDFCPAHIGAIVHMVPWCIREIGRENLDPGDVLLHNDPFRGGCHLPEFLAIRPIFADGDVVAYAATIGHMVDVGGMVPGGFGSTQTIFQEGIRIPPVKVYRRGEENEDVLRILLTNVRIPHYAYGDLKAMIGSLAVAERRVLELTSRYGTHTLAKACADIQRVSETMSRAFIRGVPDGEYPFEGFIEDDGVEPDAKWRIKVCVVVRGDEIIVDFTGSDPQSGGPANQTYGVTASASYAALLHLYGDIPRNAGCYRPVTVIAPPGTFVNVEYPGSCMGGNTDSSPTTIDIVLAALCEVVGKGVAGDGDTFGILTIGGKDPATGNQFAYIHYDSAGWGGRWKADGSSVQGCKNGNGGDTPVEVLETRYPFQVSELTLNTEPKGKPGAGRHRGGFGMRRVMRVLSPVTLSAHTNRNIVRPWGSAGGNPGGNCELLFRPAGDSAWRTARELWGTTSNGKFSNIPLGAGDEIRLSIPGGGGYGDPLARDPNLVAADIQAGLYTPDEALAEYGVVISPQSRTVDAAATAAHRTSLERSVAG